jgi:hypothetical protein
LRHFLRASFDQHERALGLLEEELTIVRMYLDIEMLRFGSRLPSSPLPGHLENRVSARIAARASIAAASRAGQFAHFRVVTPICPEIHGTASCKGIRPRLKNHPSAVSTEPPKLTD